MIVTPDYEHFAETYTAGRAGVLRATLVGDLLTPVAAFMRLRHDRAGAAFLLESVEGRSRARPLFDDRA
jgi:anthranilate synthase component 1